MKKLIIILLLSVFSVQLFSQVVKLTDGKPAYIPNYLIIEGSLYFKSGVNYRSLGDSLVNYVRRQELIDSISQLDIVKRKVTLDTLRSRTDSIYIKSPLAYPYNKIEGLITIKNIADNGGNVINTITGTGYFQYGALRLNANTNTIERTTAGSLTLSTSSGSISLSTTTGALIVPRMTTTQRTALTGINGMIVYDTDLNAFYFYENSTWVTK